MTLDYYIYEVRALLPKDWPAIDNRIIIRWINLQRAVWLKNELNKDRLIDDKIKQTIITPMEIVNRSEIPGIKSKHVILKSTLKIPTTIVRHYRDGIISTHNSDYLSEEFNYVTQQEAIYSGSGKLNQNETYSFLYNDHIYIKLLKCNLATKLIDSIVVSGVFENPLEVAEMAYTGEQAFDILKVEYPLPDALWTYMKQQVINNGSLTSQNEEIEKRS